MPVIVDFDGSIDAAAESDLFRLTAGAVDGEEEILARLEVGGEFLEIEGLGAIETQRAR